MRHVLVGLGLVAIAACAGLRHDRATRYRGWMLDARRLGAEQLAADVARDPAIRQYVAEHGPPDYVLSDGPDNVELVYVAPSVLAHFFRATPDAPTLAGELTPLPQATLDVLPADIRAGTPLTHTGPAANCWSVPIAATTCRTCCRGPEACVVECK